MHKPSNLIVKLLFTTSALFGLCSLGPAPIQGQALGLKPHTNLQAQDEKTLESEQTPVVLAPVGAPEAPHHDQEVTAQAGSHDAVSVLSAAQRVGSGAVTSNSASQVLGAASARMGSDSNHSWLWVLLVLGCVVGGMVGVKRWADNNIPETAPVTPKHQGW